MLSHLFDTKVRHSFHVARRLAFKVVEFQNFRAIWEGNFQIERGRFSDIKESATPYRELIGMAVRLITIIGGT